MYVCNELNVTVHISPLKINSRDKSNYSSNNNDGDSNSPPAHLVRDPKLQHAEYHLSYHYHYHCHY